MSVIYIAEEIICHVSKRTVGNKVFEELILWRFSAEFTASQLLLGYFNPKLIWYIRPPIIKRK